MTALSTTPSRQVVSIKGAPFDFLTPAAWGCAPLPPRSLLRNFAGQRGAEGAVHRAQYLARRSFVRAQVSLPERSSCSGIYEAYKWWPIWTDRNDFEQRAAWLSRADSCKSSATSPKPPFVDAKCHLPTPAAPRAELRPRFSPQAPERASTTILSNCGRRSKPKRKRSTTGTQASLMVSWLVLGAHAFGTWD